MFVEWCIANYLALSYHDTLLFDNPSQVDSDKLSSLRLSLDQCNSFEEIHAVLTGISEQECFAILLSGLNKNCLSDGWCVVFEVGADWLGDFQIAASNPPGYSQKTALRSAVNMLSWDVRCLLYCLLRCVCFVVGYDHRCK